MRFLVAVLSLLVLSGCAQAQQETALRLTEQAQSLLRENGRDQFHPEALALLDQAVALDPRYLPARQERLNQFLVKPDLKLALEEAREVARIQGDVPEAMLLYCLVYEHEYGPTQDALKCYESVANGIKGRGPDPHRDLNYALALRMNGAPDSEAVAEQHLQTIEHEEVRALAASLLQELAREEVVNAFLPVHHTKQDQ
ncbi:hypothetical protein MLC59_18060 [Marinobacter bryozoorum]|uniref:hypothetical protein n=1 Tax=Marinobacter bryozoorum TaxID=256324 RepID=UPI002004FAEF|nr:hypothetical protein [Marinobacter bryozoorum]MCK7546066.1 hypothetical protein [Marinobacter bryozoorum]